MLDNYSKHINELILEIIDDKLKQSLSTNAEIKQQTLDRHMYDKAFSDLVDRMDEEDKAIIDDYLSLNNCINSILFCDIYKYGFYDCVDLLKDLKII
ncbi:hypothetical protein [Vallitalea guaymasensis]|uniref:hypothetical protein n=1 Tax=Vallitalea guaymasensis TaxID=1185412 RepID=UPI00272B374A|nr:hypothetical protein [Vallitalea guaymasensis]